MVQSAISTHQHESYEPTKNDNRVPTKFCAVLHWLIFSTVFGNASPLVRRETVPDLDTASFHLPRVDRPPSLCLPRANLFGCFPPATSSKGHHGPMTHNACNSCSACQLQVGVGPAIQGFGRNISLSEFFRWQTRSQFRW